MNNTLNVLSIDWDYFIDADIYTRCTLFPDCPNSEYTDFIQTIIWSSRYSNSKLAKIGVDHSAIDKIAKIISDSKLDPDRIAVYKDHTNCYDFVEKLMEELNLNNLNITNIDFHHDVYRDYLDGIDCGNWLLHLINRYPEGNYTWIYHSGSDHKDPEANVISNIMYSFDNVFNQKWDAIYICKSTMWSPPHLDKEFINFLKIANINENSIMEPAVLDDRYSASFDNMVQYDREVLDDFRKRINES